MITLIDGQVSHREEGFLYELNDDTTLEYCEKNIAPYFMKKVNIDDGIDFKIEAECYEGDSRE